MVIWTIFLDVIQSDSIIETMRTNPDVMFKRMNP
jgi:hypothetical protein